MILSVKLLYAILQTLTVANVVSSFVTPPLYKSLHTPLSQRRPPLYDSNNQNDDTDLSWIKNAMNTTTSKTPSSTNKPPSSLKPGLSGFATDPNRGFLAVLSDTERATTVLVSPTDKQQISSPEALCLIQLAGGMDLGTVVTPDLLSEIADEKGVSLNRVRAVPNDATDNKNERTSATTTTTVSSKTRDDGIETNAPKIHTAVKNLPGLSLVSIDDVALGLRDCADETGRVNDRATFATLLEVLRDIISRVPVSHVKFLLTVSVIDSEGIKEREIEVGALEALGLSLRYKVGVEVDKEVFEGEEYGFDAGEVGKRYSTFRPMEELKEDAQLMQGFIPSMYAKAVKDRDEDGFLFDS